MTSPHPMYTSAFVWHSLNLSALIILPTSDVSASVTLWASDSSVRVTIADFIDRSVNYINYSLDNQNNILFFDVSTSRRKSSSGLTSGSGRQYVGACPIRGSICPSPRD